ncbi:MFS transporter [Nisaea acidiphila]|uniref:MFS transporter n=1 Tax=Nisaea acidiphila TaxID=1862145 RepID=A0A9J7AKD8_9PROT|nr:MFS transporter [Nisaea acidiphila]UUX48131.1 MFS transporter [Nisaea acidiphila]
MNSRRLLLLNLGHALDHLFMLLFPAVAALAAADIGDSYGSVLVLATGSFIAFGACSLPAGWLGDRWGRERMMSIFFTGIGGASILTGLADSYWHLAASLTLLGVFAAIYHPVGIAMVAKGGGNVGRRLGVNGVWGNMGVAASALAIGAFADFAGWRAAFFLLGAVSICAGLYWSRLGASPAPESAATKSADHGPPALGWQRVLLVIGISAAIGGFIFNAMTVALPKVLDDRLAGFAFSATEIGAIASAVYAAAAFSQIVVGRAIDRHAIKPIFLAVTAGQAAALFIAVNLDGWAMVAASAAVMVLVFGQIPINDTLVARYTPDRWRGRVYAVKYVLTFTVSAAVVPGLSWLYDEGGGFPAMFLTGAAAAAIITATVMLLPGRRPATVAAAE